MHVTVGFQPLPGGAVGLPGWGPNNSLNSVCFRHFDGRQVESRHRNVCDLSERQTHRQEEEDDGEERQPQPVLQRVLRFHGGPE
jgi:hypothetical protein